jgi:hypothetical protein
MREVIEERKAMTAGLVAEAFRDEARRRGARGGQIIALQLKVSPFRAGMEGKAYELPVGAFVLAPKPATGCGIGNRSTET